MQRFVSPETLSSFSGVIIDCRFSLVDPDAGRRDYLSGHVPGAHYLDLATDMSRPLSEHGGRHPLPTTRSFALTLAALGIGPDTEVICYDDSRYAFAARCWWMMRALGYREPRLVDGGYAAWLSLGITPQSAAAPLPESPAAPPGVPEAWPLCCDRDGLATLQASGARLVDAREAARYRGEHEPIDPVAGHIPGAENLPWQDMIDEHGHLRPGGDLRQLWQDLADADPLVVYCGSGVSACVNLLALDTLGRRDAWLYAGSWSDWCTYLDTPNGA